MASIQKRPGPRYRVQVRLKGRYRSATLPTLEQARRWAAQTEHRLYEQHHFTRPDNAQHAVQEFLERYEREVVPRKRPGTQAHQRTQLAWWTAELGALRLEQLTPARLAACRERLAETRAPATVNRYLAVLSHACTVAVQEWGWLEASPLRQVGRLREPRERVRCLDDTERHRLLEACAQSSNRYLLPVVVLALATGARHQELLSLTWRDVDVPRERLLLLVTKTGERRSVPLTGRALTELQTLAKVRHLHTTLVFPRRDGAAPIDIRHAWQQAVRQAGLTDFRFHDLRHCCASYLAMHGASLLDIAEVLGHKTLQMVKRYAHLTEAHTAQVVARMTAAIFFRKADKESAMVTSPDKVSAVPPLAGVVFCDLPLDAEGMATGSSRLAGSARWSFEPQSVGGTVVAGILQATRAHGYDVPEGLLFRAGQVFYHAGQIAEVRLTGLLPTGLDTTGALAFTTWSTPRPPTLTVGPYGEVRLEAADAGRSFISALAVPAQTASPEMVVACLWDLQTSAPQAPGTAAAAAAPAPSHLLPENRVVLNPAHYQALREILAHNTTFLPSEDTPWPTAPIATGPARGIVQLRPVTLDTLDWMSPEETDRWAARMWEQRKELSDLDADALDALCALWLSQAQRIEEDVIGDIDALLAMRGLQPKRNGAGEEGGYRPEQRAAMWRAILHVQNLWVHLSAVEVYQRLGIRPSHRRLKPTEEVVQSRVFSITDRLGHQRPDGFFDVEKFFFRPGKIFAHFLFGTGRQTALLAAQALRYDPVQQTWEKRLARYLSYQWRCKAHGGNLLQPFKVASLLAAIGVTLDPQHPGRTRARLEQALEILLRDHIIAAWQYDQWDEASATRRGWGKVWLQATLLIEPPENVRQHYQHLARHEEQTPLALPAPLPLGVRLRQHRQHLGLTLLQAAEQLEVSPSYLHRLEQGHRGKRLAAPFHQRLEKWLTRSRPQEDGPSA